VQLKAIWETQQSKSLEAEEAERMEELTEFMKRLEADKLAAQEEHQRQAEEVRTLLIVWFIVPGSILRCSCCNRSRPCDAQLSRRFSDASAVRDREALLNKYGFDVDAVGEGGGEGDAALGAMLGANKNKSQGQEMNRLQVSGTEVGILFNYVNSAFKLLCLCTA
jgi:hypothetical protein